MIINSLKATINTCIGAYHNKSLIIPLQVVIWDQETFLVQELFQDWLKIQEDV